MVIAFLVVLAPFLAELFPLNRFNYKDDHNPPTADSCPPDAIIGATAATPVRRPDVGPKGTPFDTFIDVK